MFFPMKWFLTIFFFSNLLLSSYFLDLWITNDNVTSRVLPVVTFVESGTWQTDRYYSLTGDQSHIGGHYYSDKAPLPSVITIPFFFMMKTLGFVKPDEHGSLYSKVPYVLGSFVCGSIPFALIISLLFLSLLRENKPAFSPIMLSMLPCYASFLFVYSGTFFGHLITALILLLSYVFLKKGQYFSTGLFLGIACTSEYTVLFLMPVWAIQVFFAQQGKAGAWKYLGGLLPGLLFILLYNYRFTGSPFDFLYKYAEGENIDALRPTYGFAFPDVAALLYLLFSIYRGIFIYVPILLLLLYIVIKHFSDIGLLSFVKNHAFSAAVVYLVVISCHVVWWGGWSYGPRQLIVPAVLLLYEGCIFISHRKFKPSIFWIVSVFGIVDRKSVV